MKEISEDKNYFGIGGWRFCCSNCGCFYYIIDGCKPCNLARIRPFIQRKIEKMKERGVPIQAYKKRARKTYYSRIVNKYINGDTDGYKTMLKRLEEVSKQRASYVKRRIVEYDRALNSSSLQANHPRKCASAKRGRALLI